MNWISLMRTVSALTVLCAIVTIHLSGVGPVAFTCLVALVLAVGFALHSVQLQARSSSASSASIFHEQLSNAAFTGELTRNAKENRGDALVPTLSESLQQLHDLQTEINQLQRQFQRDVPNGQAGQYK